MPRITHEQENLVKQKIRMVMTYNPKITVLGLKEQLDKQGLGYDKDYLYKLCKKIKRERTLRLNYALLNEKLAELEDMIELNILGLINVIQSKRVGKNGQIKEASNMDKIMAYKEIRECKKTLFGLYFDAGIFERELGHLKIDNLADYVNKYYDEPIEIQSENPQSENTALAKTSG